MTIGSRIDDLIAYIAVELNVVTPEHVFTACWLALLGIVILWLTYKALILLGKVTMLIIKSKMIISMFRFMLCCIVFVGVAGVVIGVPGLLMAWAFHADRVAEDKVYKKLAEECPNKTLLRIGDIVMLKSGGPQMIVQSINCPIKWGDWKTGSIQEPRIKVRWYNNGDIREVIVDPLLLDIIDTSGSSH